VDVILGRVRGIARGPLQHRECATLKRHQIEEAATVLESNSMLDFDQTGRSAPVFEHPLFDLHRPI
jgi:hypothetical protein